jgi:HrpA-like RNA helicase
MHRICLEKEILKLKIWGQEEPERILGRAIQPPAYNKIAKALVNLLDYGALTIPTPEHPSGLLTELGKIYAELPLDIKYSRLLMLANAFDLITPAVIVVSILGQDRRIYKTDDLYNTSLYKQIMNKEVDCDFILLINTYLHWREYIPEEFRYGEAHYKTFIKETSEEKEFCEECCLNKYILRDVHRAIFDLVRRLSALGITVPLEFSKLNDDSILLFKIVLAGAFYPKFVKCEINDYEKAIKLKYTDLKYDIRRTIKIPR